MSEELREVSIPEHNTLQAEVPHKETAPCIKCGREIPAGQTFCPLCLEDMATSPVAPGTPVVIPVQPESSPQRRQKPRRERKPEEQIRSLRCIVAWLLAILLTVIVGASVAIATLAMQLRNRPEAPRPGENYSTSADLTTT